MAVNTQKLLPGSATGGALAIRASKKTISVGRGSLAKSESGALAKEIIKMKVKVIGLQGQINKNQKDSQKEDEVNRRKSEKEKSAKKEKQYENKDGIKGANLPNIISKLPGGSIVDTIKRFLGFTLLGWLVGKYDQLMPQLEKFMAIAKPVFDGMVSLTGSLFKGIYGFVEAGYKVYDSVSATIKQISGENAEKTFKEFSSHLNKLLNGTLMLSMLIASTAPGKSGRMPGGKPGLGGGYAKPNQRLQSYLGRNNQTKLIERRYGNDAARMYEARRAQGGSHARALADVRGRYQPTSSSPGSLGGTNQGSGVFKRGLAKAPQRAATKMFGKAAGKTVSKLGGRIPIVGPLINFGIRTLIYKEPLGKAAAASVGMGVGQMLGGWLGGAIGGIVGSVVPFIGTMLVGAAGATVGSLIGGVIGDMLGAALYDFIAGFNNKGKATGQARGGTVGTTRRRTPTTPATSGKTKVQPQQTKPGQDVGGRKRIEEFYGRNKLPGRDVTKGETIVAALEKTSKDVKKLPADLFASIGGAYIDMTMGQKPDRKLASQVGKSLGDFISASVNTEIAMTTGQITKSLVGMANGGSVPIGFSDREEVAKAVSKNIEKRLQVILDQSFSIATRNIKDSYLIDSVGEDIFGGGARGGGGGAGGGGGGGDAGDFSGNTKAIKAFNYFKSQGYTDYQAAAIVGNLLQENRAMNPTLTNSIGMKGIAQWDGNRWSNLERFAKSKNLDPNDFETQLQFIQHELKTGDGGLSANTFKSTKNLEDAAVMFRKQYERPGEAEANDEARIKFARSVFSAGTIQRVEALSKGFRTGLKTGPEGRIGAGTEYHVDGRFMHNVSLKDKIAMLDSMASAHAQEGYVMEFSGAGVAGMRWNPGMSMKEKEEFAKKVLSSHHANRHPWQAFDYFIVKKSAKDRFDVSAQGSNIMAPILRDGSYEYQESGGEGRYLIIRDKKGNEIMKILHGDTGVPKPKQLGKVFKMNELTEAQQQILSQANAPRPTQLTSGQKITQALSQKGAIPFTSNGQQFFFKINPDGKVQAFKPKNILGYQEPIDISGNKNKALREAINAKVKTMYGKPKPKPGRGTPDALSGLGKGAKGGVMGSYSSLNSIKEDTSLNQQMVVMYQREIIMS